MNTEIVTLALPIQVYIDLQSLAANEQADPVEIVARLVASANRQHLPEHSANKGVADVAEQRARLAPADFSEEERIRRLRIVRRLYGAWSDEDAAAFRRMRQEMWSQWQPHSFA